MTSGALMLAREALVMMQSSRLVPSLMAPGSATVQRGSGNSFT